MYLLFLSVQMNYNHDSIQILHTQSSSAFNFQYTEQDILFKQKNMCNT